MDRNISYRLGEDKDKVRRFVGLLKENGFKHKATVAPSCYQISQVENEEVLADLLRPFRTTYLFINKPKNKSQEKVISKLVGLADSFE